MALYRFQFEIALSGLGSKFISFPLTPALSLGERENRRSSTAILARSFCRQYSAIANEKRY
jgi:hypothetical protein